MNHRDRQPADMTSPWRRRFLVALFGVLLFGLTMRAFYIQVWASDFLHRRAERQQTRVVTLPVHRGRLLDREGTPLAISAPVQAVCVNPREFRPGEAQLRRLARLLGKSPGELARQIESHRRLAFLYLKRQVPPGVAGEIARLNLEGLFFRREFRRYYPMAEVTAHLLGFTDIDQHGQEGLERRFEARLLGLPGKIKVIQDRRGRVIERLGTLQPPRPGHDIRLSIDRRLQYRAYLELKRAVSEHRAKGGMLVLLDAHSGEILAMANQPTFNPNVRPHRLRSGGYRNRAVVDSFEPGSTLKPLSMACALKSGAVRPRQIVDTRPGWMRVGRQRVRDHRNYGVLDLAGVLKFSSNVGITQVALRMSPETFHACLRELGIAAPTGIEFPGEARGKLDLPAGWGRFEQAALSFGYGLTVSALQLARAYTVFADDGVLHSVTLLPRDHDDKQVRVLPATVARHVRAMLEGVVSRKGTAWRARIPGYRVAGKTGTVKVAVAGGYAKHRYRALFVGMAPASAPRLVMAVVIDEPGGELYYGGQVAAPVFSRVMGLALRLLGVPPDDIPGTESAVLVKAGGGLG